MDKEPVVWINAKLVAADEAHLSVFDLGVSVGFGVFETLIAYRGVVPNFPLHYRRLEKSAALIEIELPDEKCIRKAIDAVIVANELGKEPRVRVRITLGAGKHVVTAKEVLPSVENNLIISAVSQAAPAPYAELALVPMRCNEHGAMSGVKTISYGENVLAFRYAAKQGADEAVMLNTSGDISECSMSNIFLVKGNEVITPPLSSGCLPGVTRLIILNLCRENQIVVRECTLQEADLFSADEIFITSSAREVQPAKMMGSSLKCPGDITQTLIDGYQKYIREEMKV